MSKKPRGLRLARVTEQQVEDLHEELLKVWDEYNIISFHRAIVEEQTQDVSSEIKAAMYAKEIESYKKKSSTISKCMHGIIAREACLKNISEL